MHSSKNKKSLKKRGIQLLMVGLRSVGIVGTGSYIPEPTYTNQDLIDKYNLDSSDAWVQEKIGIKTRHFASDEDQIDLGVKACEKALETAKVKPEDVDFIISVTRSGHVIVPGDAHYIQDRLQSINASCLDINMACSGPGYAMAIAQKFIADGTYDTILIVTPVISQSYINFKDRGICFFFGDGAGAIVMKPAPEGKGILSTALRAEGKNADKLVLRGGGSKYPIRPENVHEDLQYTIMDGKAVWEFAIRAFPEIVNEALKKANIKTENVDFLISHQANINLIKKGMEALGLPMTKTYTTIEKYGNTSAASQFISLDEAVRLGKIKDGDLVVLAGFGVGFSSSSVVMRWCYDGKTE